MKKSMHVYIFACQYVGAPAYWGSTVILPTHQEAVKDAFQRARVKNAEPYFCEAGDGWPEFIRLILKRCDCTLDELNLLAYKLMQMPERQEAVLEGVLKLLPEINIKQVINALYNLEQFEFLPGIMCDGDIGEMMIDNALAPLLKELPEDIYPFLDTKKVGAYVREKENGVFTSKGYCYRVSEQWQEVYDGTQIPEQAGASRCLFSLRLVPEGMNPDDWEAGVWLELPYEEADKVRVLESLELESLKHCRITEMRTAIPQFEHLVVQNQDIDRMNDLAKKLSTMSSKILVKYKAVAEFESCSSLERAIELTDQLDQYEFDPMQVTHAAYARECLEQMGADLKMHAFQRFDFEGYGKELYDQTGRKLTAYGAVSKEPGLEEVQSQSGSVMTQGMG